MHFIKIEAAVGGTRNAQVTAMNGIERAAKKGDATRMMSCGGAVRLRGRQYASREAAELNLLTNLR
jgi:hypothetical protein